MILAAVSERFLRQAASNAALPEEDFLFDEHEVLAALRFGFPRLLIYERDDRSPLVQSARILCPALPRVALTRSMRMEWDRAWGSGEGTGSRAQDASRRVAALIHLSSNGPTWVEEVLRHLSNATGGPLPRCAG